VAGRLVIFDRSRVSVPLIGCHVSDVISAIA
jgi:hypothetical protein